MADIKIFKKNESIISIETNPIIEKELRRYFSVKAANYRFAPLYRSGIWSGDIQFFNANHELPIGLIEKLYHFARVGNYSVSCTFERFNKISKEEFSLFVDSLKLPFKPRDYQFEAAYEACCKKNLNVHISTAGGKSLVIYIICRFLEHLGLKTLILVPTQQLTEQMYSDFYDYGWDVEYKCHRLYSGKSKFFDRDVTISCWQSLYKDLRIVGETFDCLMCDEVQTAKGKSIQDLAKHAINAEYRFGFSGTFPDEQTADWYSIVGSFGPIKTFATYKSLQEDGHIAGLKIYSIILQYDKTFKLKVYNEAGKDYHKETNLINANPKRTEFILKMVQNLKENSLVLFTKKEAHGYKMEEYFREHLKSKVLVYIDGDVPIQDREDVRKLMEENNNVVLLATHGTLSAGWSVKNLHNIIFAAPGKSEIRTMQSIGRGLRLHKEKESLKLFDIVDDCSFSDKANGIRFINFSIKHSNERLEYYNEQNWPLKVLKYKLS